MLALSNAELFDEKIPIYLSCSSASISEITGERSIYFHTMMGFHPWDTLQAFNDNCYV